MKKAIVMIGLLLVAGSAYGNQLTIHAVGFHSPGPLGWTTGYPYFATVNGSPVINVMCDDWVRDGFSAQSTTQTWLANVTVLSNPDLNLLRFGNFSDPNYTPLQLYQMVGWLLLETKVVPSQSTDINYAVWQIFDRTPPAMGGPPSFGNSQSWLTLAQGQAAHNFPGVDFSQVEIFTPLNKYDDNPDSPQELVTLVPEPATLILLAGGALGVWGRRKLA